MALKQRMAGRMERSFALEARRGRELEIRGRTAALIVIAVLILRLLPFESARYYLGIVLLFVFLGLLRLWLDRRRLQRTWHLYAFAGLDFALITFAIVYPNPISQFDYPAQLNLRYGNFAYFYVGLVGLAFSFQPLLVLWGGFMGAVSFAAGIGWLATLPETNFISARGRPLTDTIAVQADPHLVDIGVAIQEIVVFLIVAALLAAIVARSRRLVWRQAALERERSNLARYFPPATVDHLAQNDEALTQTREQNVAVMFVDLVGFTSWSERHTPAEVIGMLRDVHRRLEEAVFTHHGTLDKFTGDGLMATFGTPEPGPSDAGNALACMRSMLDTFLMLEERRRRKSRSLLRISIGVHYGPVVVGDIGTERRLELAVLGDTVNVASRLEELTRELDCHAVVSQDLIDAVRREHTDDAQPLIEALINCGPQPVRGRAAPVNVWTCY